MATRLLSAMLIRVALGTVWATVLYLAGLWVATWLSKEPLIGDPRPAILGGVCGMSCGLYLFCTIVANRLFPRADRRVCGAIEWISGALFAALLVATMAAWWFTRR